MSRTTDASAGDVLDPGIQGMLDRWTASGMGAVFAAETATQARERDTLSRDTICPPYLVPVASIEDRELGGPGGRLPIRVIRPAESTTTATIVYFHGGGWAVGNLDSHEGHARRLARTADAVVVSVDYRLAPEHPYPAGLDDAVFAVEWVLDHPEQFGGSADDVAVAGCSSGGNLATAAAWVLGEKGRMLVAQHLNYPVTDLRIFDPKLVGWYLGAGHDELVGDPRVSPVTAPSLARMPPAVIGVGTLDSLRGDNDAFVEALRRDGVEVSYRVFPGLSHGFFGFGAFSEASDSAAEELCRETAKLLHGAAGSGE